MSTSKHIDKICCVIVALTLIVSVLAVGFGAFDELGKTESGYEFKLFDDTYVHSIDIVMDDWASFLETCENEEYAACSVVIDGEAFKNVAIRAKGNTSLSSVSAYGNNRYSFKVEFDHYERSGYYGLDKLSLNNLIQDNTYMKDYLVYTLMRRQGVSSPLCSFVKITVNGELWGLYLAVEGVEDSFLTRNYGSDYGELYKPDSMSMGGGRGNGKEFSEDVVNELLNGDITTSVTDDSQAGSEKTETEFKAPTDEANNLQKSQLSQKQNSDLQLPQIPINENGDVQLPDNLTRPESFGGGRGGMNGSSDVLLQYTDDNHNSYSNIFENAKTDITDADKDRLIQSLKVLGEGTDITACVDVEQVIRYFVVHNFVCNFDSYTGQMIHNYYLYEKDGKMSMIPWDYNLAFGGFMSGADAASLVNFPIDTPVSGGNSEDRPMIAWIFSKDEYSDLYHKYFGEMITEVFDNGWFEQKFDDVLEMISPYVESDPTSFCTYDEFIAGVETLREFCLLRAQSVKGQLDGTIPSTSQGQSADKTNLVQTGDLNINTMGSMGKGMGGANGKDSFAQDKENLLNQNTAPDNTQSEETLSEENQSAETQPTENEEIIQPQKPGGAVAPGQMPQGEMPQGEFPQGQMPQGEMPRGEFPQGQMPQDEASQNTDESSSRGNRASGDDNTTSDRNNLPRQNGTITSDYTLILVLCVVLLVVAIAFALCFKRNKKR